MSAEIGYILLGVIFFVFLILIRSLRFSPGTLTSFELSRRVAQGDAKAKLLQRQQQFLPDIEALCAICDVILTVLIILCLVRSLGWGLGTLLGILVLLIARRVALSNTIVAKSQRMYQKYENAISKATVRVKPVLRLVGGSNKPHVAGFKIHSKEELLHLIHEARNILSEKERRLLLHAMKFEERVVREIMTPRSAVETVNKTETIGPIVLDRLHKTGHSRFPVINKDIDHVIGLLYTHNLVIGSRQLNSASAEKVMEKKVFYINEAQPLAVALAAFLRTRSSLFIVVNELEETTGVITIEDAIETLIGHKPKDEFDQYEDLRAVARRATTSRL